MVQEIVVLWHEGAGTRIPEHRMVIAVVGHYRNLLGVVGSIGAGWHRRNLMSLTSIVTRPCSEVVVDGSIWVIVVTRHCLDVSWSVNCWCQPSSSFFGGKKQQGETTLAKQEE